MAKTAVAAPSVDIEAIDRLEQKLKQLVAVLDRTRAEGARATDELARTRAEGAKAADELARARGEHQRATDENTRAQGRARDGARADCRGRRGGLRTERASPGTGADPQPRGRHAQADRGAQPLTADMGKEDGRLVSVEINGLRYPIRSQLDPAYVADLAAYVEEKMQLAARESPAGDTLKIAVLAALNIADECFRARDERSAQRSRPERADPRTRTDAGPGARPDPAAASVNAAAASDPPPPDHTKIRRRSFRAPCFARDGIRRLALSQCSI